MNELNTILESKGENGKVTHKIESSGTLYIPSELDNNLSWKDAEIEKVGASQDYRFSQSPNHQASVDYMTALFAYDGTGQRPVV